MNDQFAKASGLITTGYTDIRAQEARERQALEDRVAQMRRDHQQAEKDRQEAAFQEQIAQQTEAGLRGNQQLQAQRLGIGSRAATSQGAEVVLPMAEIEKTTVKVLGGIEVSYRQAKDMAEVGQISQGEFNKPVVDGLAARGYAAPKSFR